MKIRECVSLSINDSLPHVNRAQAPWNKLKIRVFERFCTIAERIGIMANAGAAYTFPYTLSKGNTMKNTTLLAAIAGLILHAGVHAAPSFTVSSDDVADGKMMGSAQVYEGFGCSGGNLAPQLAWQHAPAGTRSFAVTVYDPDAPTGSGWWHWSVFNLPASTSSLPHGATAATLPAGAVQGRNDYGNNAFGGACPPAGDKPHRYQVTVWALKVDKLPLDQQSSAAMLGYMLSANALGKARITPVYGR